MTSQTEPPIEPPAHPTTGSAVVPIGAGSRSGRRGGHLLVGVGNHSQVYRRPGSPRVVQVFDPSTRLTAARLLREHAYLRVTYEEMPELIGPQHLIGYHAAAPLHELLLVKPFVDVDPTLPLLQARAEDLPEPHRRQLEQFLAITRDLVALPLIATIPATGVPRLPDLIDDQFRNLAFDRDGVLRLLDTNELISTAQLYDLLGTGEVLDLRRRRVHGKWFARMLLLESLVGRDLEDLTVDPLYRGYLSAEQIRALHARSADPTFTAHPASDGRTGGCCG